MNGISILVCGSQKFSDRAFVYGLLDALDEQLGIGTLVTSKFSGACQLAHDWANELNKTDRPHKIKIKECNFDSILSERAGFLFDSDMYTLDKELIEHDPFFQNGKDKMMELGVNMVMAFPNQTGELGVHTHNLVRFADLASIRYLNAAQALAQVTAYRENAKVAKVSSDEPKGLKNSHPSKKF